MGSALGSMLGRCLSRRSRTTSRISVACNVCGFLPIFEEYVEKIPKLLPTPIEFARDAVDTLQTFRRELENLDRRQDRQGRQGQVNSTVADIKERTEETLKYAQEYKQACEITVEVGSNKSEIGAIKEEINRGQFDRLLTFIQKMTDLFAECRTRLDRFMRASESAKKFIYTSVRKMDEKLRKAKEQTDMSVKTAVLGGAVVVGGLMVAGPIGLGVAAVGGGIALMGVASAVNSKRQMDIYSEGLQKIADLNRNLNGVRININTLQQKMSDCNRHLIRVDQFCSGADQRCSHTTTKYKICHALDCMCRNFAEIQVILTESM